MNVELRFMNEKAEVVWWETTDEIKWVVGKSNGFPVCWAPMDGVLPSQLMDWVASGGQYYWNDPYGECHRDDGCPVRFTSRHEEPIPSWLEAEQKLAERCWSRVRSELSDIARGFAGGVGGDGA
jgi:hypothetical protein